ncbi:MAG: class I SAM-dependent methyltransferase [Clostridia bacterium]
MALDLGSARHWARALQLEAAGTGSTCLDATMGNGGDTEALCRLVGPSGRVYAFDVQPEALESTRARLAAQGFAERARLFLLGHEHMAEVVREPLDLIVFNLGWLPGVPDKTLTTRAQTTLQALAAAQSLLKKGGLVTVCAYPGHDEGARELACLLDWAAALDARTWQVVVKRYWNQPPQAPVLIALQRIK